MHKIPATLLDIVTAALGPHEYCSGRHYYWKCPFHTERSPSFCVYDKTGDEHWHCYGAGCGRHGDAIDFVRLTHGVSFRQALEWLKATPLSANEQQALKLVRAAQHKREEELREQTLSLFRCSEWHLTYHDALWYDTAGKEIGQPYLAARGITADQADAYLLGFCEHAPWGPSISIPWGKVEADGTWTIHDIQYREVAPIETSNRYRWDWRKPYKGLLATLYRQQALTLDDPVWIVEGAFKTLALERLGINSQGIVMAQSWDSSWAGYYTGRHVAVCLDPDAIRESETIAHDIQAAGGFPRVIDLWEKPDDWIKEGATLPDFEAAHRQGRLPPKPRRQTRNRGQVTGYRS